MVAETVSPRFGHSLSERSGNDMRSFLEDTRTARHNGIRTSIKKWSNYAIRKDEKNGIVLKYYILKQDQQRKYLYKL